MEPLLKLTELSRTLGPIEETAKPELTPYGADEVLIVNEPEKFPDPSSTVTMSINPPIVEPGPKVGVPPTNDSVAAFAETERLNIAKLAAAKKLKTLLITNPS